MFDDEEYTLKVLEEYSGLVRSIASSAITSSSAIGFADLCQIGDYAVLKAVKTFDPSCGANIKTYISKIVRQDIYNEAGRFLGIFTVDHKVTSLAAKINALHEKGFSDEEIADKLSKDIKQIKNLRIIYKRRDICELSVVDNSYTDICNETTIKSILDQAVTCHVDEIILNERILGSSTVEEVSKALEVSKSQVYSLENDLKDRIKQIIEDSI